MKVYLLNAQYNSITSNTQIFETSDTTAVPHASETI